MTEGPYAIDLMTANPVVVGPQVTAWVAVEAAEHCNVHHLLVVDRYKLVGVVCLCDLLAAEAAAPVADCMHVPPVTLDDQATADAAAELMVGGKVGCLPIVDWSGALRGVVTRRDLRSAGVLPAPTRRCATCGSTHGIRGSNVDSEVAFCLRCLEHGTPTAALTEETSLVLGGEH